MKLRVNINAMQFFQDNMKTWACKIREKCVQQTKCNPHTGMQAHGS
jgi:hypothetical protein